MTRTTERTRVEGRRVNRAIIMTTPTSLFRWPLPHNSRAEPLLATPKLRRATMDKLKYSLRQLYRTLEQSGDNPLRAHAQLDSAARAAYGMPE